MTSALVVAAGASGLVVQGLARVGAAAVRRRRRRGVRASARRSTRPARASSRSRSRSAARAGSSAARRRRRSRAGGLPRASSTPRERTPRASLQRLAELGVAVKIATGDNAVVAEKVCGELGMAIGRHADRRARSTRSTTTSSPRPHARPRSSPGCRPSRRRGSSACSARRAARSGSSATASTTRSRCTGPTSASRSTRPSDVAKDAADVLLLDKDLGVLADGVTEGRRIFANTIKYVLMGTSSNFGNMFSASVASVVLPFLPMLPGQILLNNLLYDTGQLAIPTDRVDAGAAASAVALGHRRDPPVHAPVRPDQLALRLRDVRTDALRVPGGAARVPLRLVHRVHRHADAHRVRRSARAGCRSCAAARRSRSPCRVARRRRRRHLASVLAAGRRCSGSPRCPRRSSSPSSGWSIAYLVLVEATKLWYYARLSAPRATPVRRRGYQHRVGRRASRFTALSPQSR